MSDILEQINSLTEQFSNLFEVEGLGDPASDVPPSTNKIKKDRKTKDGKVELVSVEDELFPYDGNKREQYRQKIINTINNMIQGTATLEDLLQIVRQKKMPVKEGFEGAIEILENLREQIDKKVKAGEINLDKALKLDKKIEDKMSSEKNAQEYYEELDKRDKKERLGDKAVAKSIRRNERKNANEGFEGAIELLEDLINEVSDATVERAVTHASKKVSDTLFKAGGTNQDTINQYKKIKKLADLRAKRTGRKLEADVDAGKYKHVDLKEAQEILETALDAIKKSDLPDEKKSILRSKLSKARGTERRLADEKAWKSWAKGDLKNPDVDVIRNSEFTKNGNGARKTRIRSGHYDKMGNSKIKPEWKQVEDSIKRHEKKTKLGEAVELLEDLYTKIKKEHGEPEYAGIDSHPANKSAELIHKMSDAKGKEYAEEKEKNPDINLYNKRCTTKNTRGEQKTQNRSSQYRKFSDDWRLPKTDDEKITASIRRNKLKPVKEAQELLEEIINEVSLKAWKEAARNSYDKRKEIADKSAELDKANWDSYEKAVAKSPEDEPELYRLAQKNSEQAYKDEQRAKHADKVRYVAPDSKHSANKYLKAAHNAEKTNSEKADYRKSLYQDEYAQKAVYARHKADMDPVKSRTNESCALSELFDRPDLLDDISMALTNKTIKQHLENQAKKLLGGKKKIKKEK